MVYCSLHELLTLTVKPDGVNLMLLALNQFMWGNDVLGAYFSAFGLPTSGRVGLIAQEKVVNSHESC